MFFTIVDSKQDCFEVFFENEMRDKLSEDAAVTWSYSPYIGRPDIEYVSLYFQGDNLDAACPEHLKENYNFYLERLKAYLRSFKHCKLSLEDNCFYDLVPRPFLKGYLESKNKIIEHVYKNYKRPPNYEHLCKVQTLCKETEIYKLNLDFRRMSGQMHAPRARKFTKKYKNINKIKYNMFKAITGRLSLANNSFPILNMPASYRSIVMPNNDFFVELDFNANELRVFLALSGHEQPNIDMHDWNVKHVFRGIQTRKEAKERIFAWLYNPNSKDLLANRAYDREGLKEKFWDGKIVKTPYGREINSDDFHSLNYLIQSTSADLVFEQAYNIYEYLQDKPSTFAFMMHDSVIIDFCKEDLAHLEEMVDIFSNTKYGKFLVNVSAGKDYGDMQKRCI
jgi:hypothetical protein